MAGQVEPHIVANIWQQAAEKVASLRQEASEDPDGTWREAIEKAETLLRKEADDVLFMARMAHLLIVGNIVAAED